MLDDDSEIQNPANTDVAVRVVHSPFAVHHDVRPVEQTQSEPFEITLMHCALCSGGERAHSIYNKGRIKVDISALIITIRRCCCNNTACIKVWISWIENSCKFSQGIIPLLSNFRQIKTDSCKRNMVYFLVNNPI